ncbi:cryptococcal mannosyltransferase 1 domain-containing protein [Trichoderma breve]|uniref:Cryptococcal mannosyltransferase 1 domain-containing protein n=1 Tax=Trichoderma breve TaxID=2034170 RepID=A0A9W9BAX0_9HYPO|nr:cryptococcal mannosyltransferase 1 domain-containing protein [Trichoderma breve]KAJ4859765.1 cryptococcal mannosyltransferase 1 domain-containing protein [Trichoderma breve]
MRTRLLILAAPLIAGFIVATTLLMGRDRFARPLFQQDADDRRPKTPELKPTLDGWYSALGPRCFFSQTQPALADPSRSPSLECPAINRTRYGSLNSKLPSDPAIKYFFALNLRQNLPLLPQLIGSIVEAIRFLGPTQCVLSIVEGNSPDGTADVLAALRPALESLRVTYYFESSAIDPSKDNRVARLAQLRNKALAPLLDLHGKATSDTTVIFLNDVSACSEDILELVHQRNVLGADMTCAMDWTYVGEHPTFYDVWIARTIHGDSFFEIPPDGNWNSRPFQVFSCWNGATAFTVQPILEKTVEFRAANETAGECRQGEPQLFCKDLWFKGYRKIAVVPSVNLEYSVEKAKKIKEAKGFTSDTVSKQEPEGDKIEWRLDPPSMVKCMPTWENQYWQSWNETLKP